MPGAQNDAKGQGPEQGQEQERDSEAARLSGCSMTTVTPSSSIDADGPTDRTLEADTALNQLIVDITTAVRELNPAQRSVLLGGLRATLEELVRQRGEGGSNGGGEGGGDGGGAGVLDSHAPGMSKSIILASYSPAEVVHRFASIPRTELRMLAEPEKHDFIAAVGFVDVSGFTKLSEKLASEHGRAGAEMLNLYVNAYFAKLIDGINRYAGDVIKFAGDAPRSEEHTSELQSPI